LPDIKQTLRELNPWWREDFHVDYRPREVYQEIQRFLPQPQIIALTGLRRVGKTTLLLKTVEDAIAGGMDPRRILYFSFDETREAGIREIVAAYQDVTGTDLRSGSHLLLLDEVQKLVGWQDQVKAFYDRYKGRVKIMMSGSESLFIRHMSRETLAGRLFEFRVNTLSFREYLAFQEVPFEPLSIYEDELKLRFDEFIRTQGFPELVGQKDRVIIRKYVKEGIVDSIIFRDLITLLPIREPAILESVLHILMEEPGQIILLEDLAGQLGISRHTLSSYMSYLEDAFLLRKLYNYSKSRRKVQRKLKRYYPTVLSVDLLFQEDELSRSRVLESLVVNQLHAEYFWRDPYRHEVDTVLSNGVPIPVEVKSGRIDLRGLRGFMRRFGVPRGYVVTQDRERMHEVSEGEVREVPAYKFLLKAGEIIGVSR
jgi:predicted AAA+ superfamily ATPase